MSNVFTRACYINQPYLLPSVLLRCWCQMSSHEHVISSNPICCHASYFVVDVNCLHMSMLYHPILSVVKRLTSLLMSNVFTWACYIIQSYLLPNVLLRCWCQMSSQEHVISTSPICYPVSYFVVDVKCLHKSMTLSCHPALSVCKCLTLLLMSIVLKRARHSTQFYLLPNVLLRCWCQMSSQEHVISSNPICCQTSYFVVDVKCLHKSMLYQPALSVTSVLLRCWCQLYLREHVIPPSSICCQAFCFVVDVKCLHKSMSCQPALSVCQASYFVVDVKCLHKSMLYQPALSVTQCLTSLLMSNVSTWACYIIQSYLLSSVLLRCWCQMSSHEHVISSNPICCQASYFVVDVKCLHMSMLYHPILSVVKRLTSLLMSNVFTWACYIIQPYILPNVLLCCWCQMSSQEHDIMSSSPICVQVSYFVVDVNCIEESTSFHPVLSVAKRLTSLLMSNVFTRACHVNQPYQASYFVVDVKCLHMSMLYHPILSVVKHLASLSMSNVFTMSMLYHPVLSVAKRLTLLMMSNVFTRVHYVIQPYLLPSVLLCCPYQISSREHVNQLFTSSICWQASCFVVDVFTRACHDIQSVAKRLTSWWCHVFTRACHVIEPYLLPSVLLCCWCQ